MHSEEVIVMGAGLVTLEMDSVTPAKNEWAFLGLGLCVCVHTSLTQHNTWLRIDWIVLLFILWKVMLKGGQLKNNINVLSSNLTTELSRRQRGDEKNMSSRASEGRKERSVQVLRQDGAKANTVDKRNILSSKLFWDYLNALVMVSARAICFSNILHWQYAVEEDAHLSLHPFLVILSVSSGVTLSSQWFLTLLWAEAETHTKKKTSIKQHSLSI